MDEDMVVEVFTHKSVETMLAHGGSQSWVMSAEKREKAKYLVCVRNTDPPDTDDTAGRPEARNSAFFVGEISGTRWVAERNNRNRYLINIRKYALVDVPDFRTGASRNPVTYSTVRDCRSRGIDIKTLNWQPMDASASLQRSDAVADPSVGISIAQAKQALAVHYGVEADDITITITG